MWEHAPTTYSYLVLLDNTVSEKLPRQDRKKGGMKYITNKAHEILIMPYPSV
jgi:hypothetical protein